MHKQGDIVLVPLPFTDLSTVKRRGVHFGNNDMADGVLKAPSLVRADKIYTLSKNVIVKRFGSVKPDFTERIKAKVIHLLGCDILSV